MKIQINSNLPLAERFALSYIPEPYTCCWIWTGALIRRGANINAPRPKINHLGKRLVAARVSWELHRGPIPEGMCVCHSCDNSYCVNPDHLWIGTQKQNLADMRAKGRAVDRFGKPIPANTAFKTGGQI